MEERKEDLFHWLLIGIVCLLIIIIFGAKCVNDILKEETATKETDTISDEELQERRKIAKENSGKTPVENIMRSAVDSDDVYQTIKEHYEEEYRKIQERKKQEGENRKPAPTIASSSSEEIDDSGTSYLEHYNEAKVQTYQDIFYHENTGKEQDTVKQEGEYLYSMGDKELYILKTSQESVSVEATILWNGESCNYVNGRFYVEGDQLMILFNQNLVEESPDSAFTKALGSCTRIQFYDISDKSNPVLVKDMSQDGGQKGSFVKNGYLYVFSQRYAIGEPAFSYKTGTMNFGKEDYEEFLPKIDGEYVTGEDLYLPMEFTGIEYFCMSAISISKEPVVCQKKAVMSNIYRILYTEDSLYFILPDGYYTDYNSRLVKFQCEEGEIKAASAAIIPGKTVQNHPFMECNGEIGVFTFYYSNSQSHDFYVLNDKLEITKKLENFLPQKEIHQMYFWGEEAYFIISKKYQEMYRVDLTKGTMILSEKLELPYFTQYLQFYGKDRLLAISVERDSEKEKTKGVRLSMLDFSNHEKIKEIQHIYWNQINQSSAPYDYQSVLINFKENLIGFNGAEWNSRTSGYYVYSYDEQNGFTKVIESFTRCYNTETKTRKMFLKTRGILTKDYLYEVNGSYVAVYDRNNQYHKTATINE